MLSWILGSGQHANRSTEMKRRDFITLLGGAATWPLAASAEQPAKVPRVGILSPAASETAGTLSAFREKIRDLGYVEGETIALDFRLSKGIMDALPALAAELVRIPVNVIVTDTTGGTLAAFAATRTIPIVMGATGGDPVALGLAKSLSRPGGNVTGTNFLSGLSDKRLQLLKQAFPGAQRVAVLANPTGAISVFEMPKADTAAARIGIRLVSLAASTPAELRAMDFGIRVCKHIKSNAIAFVTEDRTLAVGGGATSRIDPLYAAREKAARLKVSLKDSVLISEALFPFPDGPTLAAEAGATAIAQPGGAMRDSEVIAAADAHGLAMVFTGVRHFRH